MRENSKDRNKEERVDAAKLYIESKLWKKKINTDIILKKNKRNSKFGIN